MGQWGTDLGKVFFQVFLIAVAAHVLLQVDVHSLDVPRHTRQVEMSFIWN